LPEGLLAEGEFLLGLVIDGSAGRLREEEFSFRH
jgi:hypothetical protein